MPPSGLQGHGALMWYTDIQVQPVHIKHIWVQQAHTRINCHTLDQHGTYPFKSLSERARIEREAPESGACGEHGCEVPSHDGLPGWPFTNSSTNRPVGHFEMAAVDHGGSLSVSPLFWRLRAIEPRNSEPTWQSNKPSFCGGAIGS